MNKKNEMLEQLQRYYALWKESNAIYEEWAKKQGLSSNGLLILYSLYDDSEGCTQKTISQKWCIPKQTVNTILKDFAKRGFIEMLSTQEDKRNKAIQLTLTGRLFAGNIMEKLQSKELCVMEKIGLERITDMNDNLALFIQLFLEGGYPENE